MTRDRLDAGRAGADDADPLAGEVDALVRPAAPVWYHLALEGVQARDVGDVGRRQAAGRHDAGTRPTIASPSSVRTVQRPVALVEVARAVTRVLERDVAAQVEPVGDVVEVAQDLRLGRRTARSTPTPARARRRTSRSSPCSRRRTGRRGSGSSTRCRRRRRRPRAPDGQPEPAEPVEHVHAGEPGADDDGVDGRRHGAGLGVAACCGNGHRRPPGGVGGAGAGRRRVAGGEVRRAASRGARRWSRRRGRSPRRCPAAR